MHGADISETRLRVLRYLTIESLRENCFLQEFWRVWQVPKQTFLPFRLSHVRRFWPRVIGKLTLRFLLNAAGMTDLSYLSILPSILRFSFVENSSLVRCALIII